jgi:hypothetical protein
VYPNRIVLDHSRDGRTEIIGGITQDVDSIGQRTLTVNSVAADVIKCVGTAADHNPRKNLERRDAVTRVDALPKPGSTARCR